MLDFLFILGQAASRLLIPAAPPPKKALSTKPGVDEMSVMHLRTHA